jgi:hypothetical protein
MADRIFGRGILPGIPGSTALDNLNRNIELHHSYHNLGYIPQYIRKWTIVQKICMKLRKRTGPIDSTDLAQGGTAWIGIGTFHKLVANH